MSVHSDSPSLVIPVELELSGDPGDAGATVETLPDGRTCMRFTDIACGKTTFEAGFAERLLKAVERISTKAVNAPALTGSTATVAISEGS